MTTAHIVDRIALRVLLWLMPRRPHWRGSGLTYTLEADGEDRRLTLCYKDAERRDLRVIVTGPDVGLVQLLLTLDERRKQAVDGD